MAPTDPTAALRTALTAMREFGISDTVLDQWEQSAAHDAEAGTSWSAHPSAVLVVLAVVRALASQADDPSGPDGGNGLTPDDDLMFALSTEGDPRYADVMGRAYIRIKTLRAQLLAAKHALAAALRESPDGE